jgi:ribonuclease R
MLPEALSAGACSLRPGEDRLSMTAILDFDSRGELRSTDLCNSWIRSDRRMTYTEMKRLLVDREPALAVELGELVADLELMGRLAELLVERREERGGLDFDLPTPLVKVDEDGLPTEIVESERNAAHRLIEEFMIAANQAVARFLDGRREPSVYRNHEPPPADKVAAFREAAKVFGHDLRGGEAPDPKAFQRVLGSAAGRPEEHLLTMLALRTMSQARYETGNGGHFGLALGHYTHFTSPIRRYPDLVVHRALKRVLAGESTPEDERDDVTAGLAEVAAHCSKAERNAEAAERALIEWKKCVFMVDKLGQRFEGRITGIAEFGVFVALVEHHVEGLVRLSALRDDYYERDATGLRLVGRRTRRTLRLGDPLRVRVAEVDVFHRRIGLEEA